MRNTENSEKKFLRDQLRDNFHNKTADEMR